MRVLLSMLVAITCFSVQAVSLAPFYIATAKDSGDLASIQAKIASTAVACAALPTRGTVYYFCDCGVGAEGDCIAGNDANDGLSTAAPKQTIAAATTLENSFSGDTQHTVAFCKGGSFVAPSGQYMRRLGCTAGTTCDDWREYTPTTFTGAAKPILRLPTGTNATVINFTSATGYGGMRFLNLAFKAEGVSKAIWFYEGLHHDVTVCNADIDGFSIPFYMNSDINKSNNIHLTGSTISNSTTIGFLGGGNNSSIAYNTWEGNGSSTALDHTLYLSGHTDTTDVTNFSVIGNYIHGQYGNLCSGAVIEGHGNLNSLVIHNNYIEIDVGKSGQGCWGIEINNMANYPDPEYFRDAIVSGNTVVNTGNQGITLSVAPGLILENNRVIHNWASNGYRGIGLPSLAAKTGEPLNDANVVRNNTVYIGPNATGQVTGINIGTEGTGHVISNNSVTSVQTAGSLVCYHYGLSPSAYSFGNNNHCYASSVSASWEHSYPTIAAWRTYSGFDANSITTAPNFTDTATYNFKPAAGSPLIGVGSNTNKSTNDFLGARRASPPSIGAYE